MSNFKTHRVSGNLDAFEIAEAFLRAYKDGAKEPVIEADADKLIDEFDFSHADTCACFICRKRRTA